MMLQVEVPSYSQASAASVAAPPMFILRPPCYSCSPLLLSKTDVTHSREENKVAYSSRKIVNEGIIRVIIRGYYSLSRLEIF